MFTIRSTYTIGYVIKLSAIKISEAETCNNSGTPEVPCKLREDEKEKIEIKCKEILQKSSVHAAAA